MVRVLPRSWLLGLSMLALSACSDSPPTALTDGYCEAPAPSFSLSTPRRSRYAAAGLHHNQGVRDIFQGAVLLDPDMRDLRDLFQAMVASVRNRATAKGLDPDALELAFKASLVANGRSRPDLPTKAREVLAEYENEPGVREKANALVSTLAELRTRGEAARQKRLGTGERMGSISLTTHDTTLLADAVADVVVTLSDSTSDVITGMFKTDTAVAYWTPQFEAASI